MSKGCLVLLVLDLQVSAITGLPSANENRI